MDGWFPKLDEAGRVASGSDGIWVTDAVGPRLMSATGTGPAWAGAQLVFNASDGTTNVDGVPVPAAYNELVGADDGRWAGFHSVGAGRLDIYRGAVRIASEPGICCPRFGGGRFAYLVPFQTAQDEVRSVVLDNAVVATGRIMDVRLSRGGEFYVYLTATGTYTRQIYDQSGRAVGIRDDEVPLVAFVGPGGEPWMLTGTDAGAFVRPVSSPLGYLITGELFYPDARMFGGRLRIVASLHDGTPRFNEWVDFSAPRTDLRVVPEAVAVPRVGRDLVVGWFTDAPNGTPGNADLWVDYHGGDASYMVTRRSDMRTLLRYVAAEVVMSIDALEAAVDAAHLAHPTVPVVAYWVAGLQQGRPPRNADYVGVEAYRLKGESVQAFEARVRAATAKCQRVMHIPQCYSSNAALTSDLASIVPVIAAVARDCLNVHGILPFSAGTRATGWSDHPEVHPLWRSLCDGVTGIADIPPRQPGILPRPVDPPGPAVPAPPSSHLHHRRTKMNIDGKTVVLRGTGGLLLRPDAPNTGTWGSLNRGWRGAIFDGANPSDAAYHFTAKAVGSHYTFQHVTTKGFVGADAGEHSPALDRQYYLTPDNSDPSAAGDLEQFRVYDGNENGALSAQCEQTTGGNHPSGPGRKFFTYPVAVEVL